MKNHRKLSGAVFLSKMNNLIDRADGNEAAYGLTVAQLTQAKAVRDALTQNKKAKEANKTQKNALTVEGKQQRKQGDDLIALMKTSAASKQIDEAVLQEIGFGGDDTIPSRVGVFDPLDLVVTGSSNGTNTTKWKKNGNKPGTIFNVEAMIGDAADFVIVGNSNTERFEHKNQKPGVKAVYRVRAQRGEAFSDYSNEATVYG